MLRNSTSGSFAGWLCDASIWYSVYCNLLHTLRTVFKAWYKNYRCNAPNPSCAGSTLMSCEGVPLYRNHLSNRNGITCCWLPIFWLKLIWNDFHCLQLWKYLPLSVVCTKLFLKIFCSPIHWHAAVIEMDRLFCDVRTFVLVGRSRNTFWGNAAASTLWNSRAT